MCMSHWTKQQTLLAHNLPETKVHVVGWGPCAVDLSREDYRSYPREKMVLHISNDFHRKGVDFLVSTALRVQQVDPAVNFVLIGRDHSGLKVEYPSNVKVLGQINDHDQLADFYRRASVFLLPHRFDRACHALAEAMSAGMPLVASQQGGPRELVDGTGAGFCIPVGEIEGYTHAILTILQNPGLALEMGRRGKVLMMERYNWTSVARAILQIVANELEAAGVAASA